MQIWIFIYLAVVLAVVFGWFAYRLRKQLRLSAGKHYLEIAREIPRVKAAALDKLIEPVAYEAPSPTDHRTLGAGAVSPLEKVIAPVVYDALSPADQRTLTTSAGLTLSYTVRRSDDRFIHHYSVRCASVYGVDLTGRMLTLFVARLLGVHFEALTLEVGRFDVCHAEFQLSADEHDMLAERLVSKVSPAEITSFRKEYMEILRNRHLRWRRLEK
ncbi:MAG: hypothetical protein ACREA2_11360 [Blastocatellia bacterium]